MTCTVPTSSCGTSSGWRAGGRCIRCRLAHNHDTSRRRGITDQQRYAFLTWLRSGKAVEEAAEDAGVTPQALAQAARRDGELRAALDGMPVSVQAAARRAEFMAALVRCGGNQTLAETQVGLQIGTVNNWRQADPGFDSAVRAILSWLNEAVGRPPRVSLSLADELADRFRELWTGGATYKKIRADLGISAPTISKWRKALGLPARRSQE